MQHFCAPGTLSGCDPITLRVGQPVRFPGSPYRKKPSRHSIAEFRYRLHAEVRELCGEAEPAPELAATEADGQA